MIFLSVIKEDIQIFVESWNNHGIQTEGEKSLVQLLLLHQHRSCGLAIDAAGGGLAAPAVTLDEDDSDSHCSQNRMETSIE